MKRYGAAQRTYDEIAAHARISSTVGTVEVERVRFPDPVLLRGSFEGFRFLYRTAYCKNARTRAVTTYEKIQLLSVFARLARYFTVCKAVPATGGYTALSVSRLPPPRVR